MKIRNKKTGEIIANSEGGKMKIRNKKTGEIIANSYVILCLGNNKNFEYDSLEKLNQEYEFQADDDEEWAKKVKIHELPSGLKIADRDYYEIDEDGEKKTEFSWNEAMERFKDDPNWRLPTPKELNQIALDLGYTDEGIFDGELFAKNLGEDSLEAYRKNGGNGNFWSSYASSTAYARGLHFYGRYLYPQYYTNKGGGFAVRCVAR